MNTSSALATIENVAAVDKGGREIVLTSDTSAAEYKKTQEELSKLTKAVEEKKAALEAALKDAADSKKQIEVLKASPSAEFFQRIDAKGENVKLRGFGSIRLIPLQDDYLVVVPANLSEKAEVFFAKVRKTVIPVNGAIFVICGKKYFTGATTAPVEAKNTIIGS